MTWSILGVTMALKDSRLCGLTQGEGARKGVACFFELLFSLPPRAFVRQFCSPRHLTSKISMVTVVLVLPCNTIRQITRPKRFDNHQKPNFTKNRDKWS